MNHLSIEIGAPVSAPKHTEWGCGQVLQLVCHPQGEQAIVEFETGRIERLPVADLQLVIDPVQALISGQIHDAAVFDLRMFAAALKTEHIRTGALSNARLSPLPHQILLVDKIVSRNLKAHLIADDVGLGKTVEAAMLYLALAQRGLAERVLIVTPAGLTLQWQETLEDLFGVIFDVFNLDFFDSRPEVWNRYPRVIASIDSLKRNRPRGDGGTGRRDVLAEADPWDLIIFDEAHRLSAEETNRGTERTQNYQLGEVLRSKARFFYLLTATPHQGKEDRFRHILRLVEPDIFEDAFADPIDAPTLNRIMTRNRKSEVTDVGGNRLFRGHRVIPVDCPLTAAEADFYRALVGYLELGYGTATSLDLAMQRAVGFVMVTFQKLAASSVAAIRQALQRRHTALTTARPANTEPRPEPAERDDRFQGEQEENNPVLQHGNEFFQNEVAMLATLLEQLAQLPGDSKVNRLMMEVSKLDELARQQHHDPEHILVFTEYRATQDLLVASLEEEFGKNCCAIIRGGMKLNEKRMAQRSFAADTRFLVSTEAGAEGINLQERSHILFNFDLPWNPMRIHQRIGRLDRYGQKEEVIAYNLQRTGTIEDRLRSYLDQKIGTIIAALRELEGDRAEDLREAVLGQVDEELDLNKIYAAALRPGGERLSQEEIDRAVASAQAAALRMNEIYGLLERFDLRAFQQLHAQFTAPDLEEFVRRFLRHSGRRLEDHKDGSYSFIVPDQLRQHRLDPKKLDLVVFDSAGLKQHPSARLVGFGDPLFDRMIAACMGMEFGGRTAVRRVPKSALGGLKRGFQFCFMVQKRTAAGERPVDWDFWSVFVDEKFVPDSETGQRLARVWSVGGTSPASEIDKLVAQAFTTAQRLVTDRLRTMDQGQPANLWDVRMMSASIVHQAD